jgi:ABC-type transport system substrate-binding protein
MRMTRICIVAVVTLMLSVWVIGPSCTCAAQGKQGGTLRIGVRVPQEAGGTDARYIVTTTSYPVHEMLYDRLYTWGEKGFESLIPNLATGYQTKDNKVWTINLRKGVKFHNGREMTAQDVKANFDWRINTPKGWKPLRQRELIKSLKKVDVVDNYTVRLTMDRPSSGLMRVLAYALRGIVPPEEAEKWGDDFAFHPCGTGPFKMVEVKPNEKVVLDRFDGYWGPKPNINRVELIFYRSDETRLVALEKGEIDMAQLYDEAKPILKNNPKLAYQEMPDPSVLHKYYFNMRRWPMNDVRFRKAVWMGADWKSMAVNAWALKSGNHARTLLEFTKYFNPEAIKLVPSYNPEEAKKLIQAVEKDAGRKIQPIYLVDATISANQNLAEMAKLQLAQIGVTLDLHILSIALWFDKIQRDPKMEWDMGGVGYGFAIDPSIGFAYFETGSGAAPDGKSLEGYSNPEFDRLARKSEAALSEKERTKSIQEAEEVLLRDVAAIPVFTMRLVFGWNRKVQGAKFTDTCAINVTNTWANMWME